MTASAPDVRLLYEAGDMLGEGAVWHPAQKRFYWTDIERCLLQSVTEDGRDYRAHRFAERLGSFAFHADGSMILALESGFARWSPPSGTVTPMARHGEPAGRTRMNDGKCDPAGRFLAGSMDLDLTQPIGSLYSLDVDGSCRQLVDGICISNSLCWSPDGSRMYFADTPLKRIDVFDYDLATGVPSHRRLFCDLTWAPGSPDGACTSSDGSLWVAMYDGSCLLRISPAGALTDEIPLPCRRPTCCAFGGEDLRQVFVTSAADRDANGQSDGCVFTFRSDASGIPMHYWTGLPGL